MAGILDTIKLAGVLVLAIPAGLAGVELLVGGETLPGAMLVGLAVGLVVLQDRLTTPGDVPGLVARRVTGAVAGDPDAEADADRDAETDDGADERP